MGDEDDDFDLDEFLSDDFDDEEDEDEEDDIDDDSILGPEDQEILDNLDEVELEEESMPQTSPPADASISTPTPMPAVTPTVSSAKKAKEGSNAANLGILPVKMVFELASLNMPFDQAQKITEGYQINIGIDLNAPITIKANGKSIGKGQLVQIEKQIGIQVTELWK